MMVNKTRQKDPRPIAFFDSGVGGLPYLQWIKENLPGENLVYLADRANFPYGEKDDAQLRRIITATVGRFIRAVKPKLMVIACNTASVVALAELRRRFDIPFVGVVPAVKPAAEHSRSCSIGILATRRTVEDPYTDDLIRSFAPQCRVHRYAGVEIVDLVENRYYTASREEKQAVLQSAVEYFKARNVDTLVIGCTHFVFVQDELGEMLGEGTMVIDSREGVGRQVMRLLSRIGNVSAGEGGPARTSGKTEGQTEGRARFFITRQEDEDRYLRFAADFGLEWGGVL